MVDFNFSTNVERADFERWVESTIKNQVNAYTRSALVESKGGESETRSSLDNTNLSLIPIGGIIAFGGTSLPKEFLWCDGASVSKDKYRRLYDVLGPNRYGSDTSTDFVLPDLKDRFPRGASTTSGNVTSSNTNTHTHTLNATAATFTGTAGTTNNSGTGHTHNMGHNHNNNGASTGGPNNNFNRATGNAGCAGTTHTHGVNGASTSGISNNETSGASDNTHTHNFTPSGNVSVTTGTAVNASHVPAYVDVNYIIKY